MAIATSLHDVTHGALRMKNLFVNLYFLGTADAWVLIDAGLPGSADAIIEAASDRFGKGNLPQAIILTHGHFDHVGSLAQLLDKWHVPVYAHEIELAHLTGKKITPNPIRRWARGQWRFYRLPIPRKRLISVIE
jgi:glyoxylase-like metal-dependent hydrolase (beta-lactamase superfamily II)